MRKTKKKKRQETFSLKVLRNILKCLLKRKIIKKRNYKKNEQNIAPSLTDNVTPVKGTSKNQEIISTQGSKLSNQGIINPLTQQIYFQESVNSVLFKKEKCLQHEK